MSLRSDLVEKVNSDYEFYYNLYLSGTEAMSRYLGVSLGSISLLATDMGWKHNPKVRRDRIELRASERYKNWLDLDSADTWYFIGYFTGDGCLQGKRYRVNIVSCDEHPILEFSERFGCELNVGTKGQYTIDMDYPSLYEELSSVGLRDRKSEYGTEVEVPEKFYGAYLRGIFDSDGTCIIQWNMNKSYNKVTFLGHESDMSRVRHILDGLGVLHTDRECVRKNKRTLKEIHINRRDSIEKLYGIMYTDNCLCIPRKRERFMCSKKVGEVDA